MIIEIKTILIDEKKLTKSLFLQLPALKYPYYSDYNLSQTILGYVDYQGTHLLIHHEDKLYRALYQRGTHLYCTKKDGLEIIKLGDGWRELEVSKEIFVTKDQNAYYRHPLHLPHVAFGDIYLPIASANDGLPMGFFSPRVPDIPLDIIDSNLKILNKMEQIFLKA